MEIIKEIQDCENIEKYFDKGSEDPFVASAIGVYYNTHNDYENSLKWHRVAISMNKNIFTSVYWFCYFASGNEIYTVFEQTINEFHYKQQMKLIRLFETKVEKHKFLFFLNKVKLNGFDDEFLRCKKFLIFKKIQYTHNFLKKYELIQEALKYNNDDDIDNLLIESYMLIKNYIPYMTYEELYKGKIVKVPPLRNIPIKMEPIKFEKPKIINKIRIGYFSPDFNKNAVGLFVTPLLKLSPSLFEIYCYYNAPTNDYYTKILMRNNVKWFNVSKLTTEQQYELIHNRHQLHVFVNLLASSDLALMKLKPAKMLINYLGYPASSGIMTHRIVDNITDPRDDQQCSEQLIKLDRCFICFKSLDEFTHINYNPYQKEFINVGVFNRQDKFSNEILKLWHLIHKKNNQIMFITKHTIPGIPKEYQTVLPFFEERKDYYKMFNIVDFCIDTFPYSGTTTTASALYMGVPTFTIYHPSGIHVSNVSASLLHHSGLNKYICKNGEDYVSKIVKHGKYPINKKRQIIRNKFMNCMNSKLFVKELEHKLLKHLR